MFYRPADGHGLPHDPFKALIVPRPIGWVSTRGADGSDNLAPYSFFNAVAYTPPQVMFASTGSKPDRDGTKDSVANVRETGVFCVNLVSEALLAAMNATSGPWPRETDEFALAGLERAPCETIPCARVAAAPAALECRATEILTLKGRSNILVIGEVTGIHIAESCLRAGRFNVVAAGVVARLGYRDYCVVRDLFELARPGEA
jgi:flavin reductase (DIM6/NTAB) family NADH-FMN oxidoreductase RutF